MTLSKLDLSCNPVHDSLEDIIQGVRESPIKVLILDYINQKKVDNCVWNIIDPVLRPLLTTNLTMLSVQANQLNTSRNIDLRTNIPYLLYLNLGLNDFQGTTLNPNDGISIDDILFYTLNLQLPRIRYLGFQSVTESRRCAEYSSALLDCNKDSELYLEDHFDWQEIRDPDLLEISTQLDFISENGWELYQIYSTSVRSRSDKRKLIYDLFWKWFANKTGDLSFITPKAVYNGIDFLLSLPQNDILVYMKQYLRSNPELSSFLQIFNFDLWHEIMNTSLDNAYRFMQTNLTTLDLRYNNLLVGSSTPQAANGFCSNIKMYPNNMRIFDLSYSKVPYFFCTNFTGLKFADTVRCAHCSLIRWTPGLFEMLPVKYANFQANNLGAAIRNDTSRQLFGGAIHLVELNVADQNDEIVYFADQNFFSQMPNLTSLDVSHNGLIAWNVTLRFNPRLANLNLEGNKIGYINATYRTEFDMLWRNTTNFTVILGDNPVRCDTCDNSTLDYLHWLTTSPAVDNSTFFQCIGGTAVTNFIQNCTYPDNSAEELAERNRNEIVMVSVVTAVGVLVILLILGLIYNNRWVPTH